MHHLARQHGVISTRQLREAGVSPIDLAVRHGTHVEVVPSARLHQTTNVRSGDVVRRADGIRIASPTRLAFDLAAYLSDEDHRSVVEQMLHERRCTPEELAAIGRRLVHPRRRGSVRFLATLAARCGPPAESHPEVRVAGALRARGVPVFAQATWLDLPGGGRARLDLCVPAVRWAVEIDAHPDHLGLDGTTADKRRDRRSRLLGWQIERVTGLDLEAARFDATMDELAVLYRRRAAGTP